MRGTSAASLDAVLQATEGAQATQQLGDELFGVVRTLDANPALRRVLTDPSVDGEAKQRLAATVFGSAVGESAAAVVAAAAGGRWSAARDLADAIEIAGVTAHVIAADSAGQSDEVQDELFAVGRLISGDAALRSTLTDRTYTSEARAELIGRILDGKVAASTVALAQQAVVARTANYEKTLQRFADIAASRRSGLVAQVRAAAPLGDAERTRLTEALNAKYGRDIHLNVVVDPAVVGGLAVSIGDETIDGSLSNKLDDARRRIAG